MNKHTSTPWRVRGSRIFGLKTSIIADIIYQPISGCLQPTADEQEANGEFIIAAVNSHDALVAALHEMVMACDDLLLKIGGVSGVETQRRAVIACQNNAVALIEKVSGK